MLPNYYRYAVYNNSGTSSDATAGAVTVKQKGWYINTSGVPVWITTATKFSNTAAITTGTFNTAAATAFDNGGAANPLVGAEVEFTFTGSGSPTGPVQLFLQCSVDGGTTWPDALQGEVIATLNPVAAAVYRTNPRIE